MDKAAYKRCILVCLGLVTLLSALSVRLVYVQIVNRETYASKAGSSYRSRVKLQHQRGLVLDRNDEIVANNMPTVTVKVDKYHLLDANVASRGLAAKALRESPEWAGWSRKRRSSKVLSLSNTIQEKYLGKGFQMYEDHLDYVLDEMSRPLGISKEELKKKIDLRPKRRGRMDVVITRDLARDVAEKLEDHARARWVGGFRFEEEEHRWYGSPELATHLVGVVDHSGVGRSGVESKMNHVLAGVDGFREEQRDIRGLVMPAHKGSVLPPKNGLNIKLTLDMGIQAIIEEELDWGMNEFEAVNGTFIVMDPHTGQVLAMASRPHFNLNNKEKFAENGFNFGLQATYEPGSTIKVIAASAALEERQVNMDTVIDCHWGNFKNGSVTVKDGYPKGKIPVWRILQKSNNIGSYKMGLMVGQRKFARYLKDFGFVKQTGIQLAGESCGSMTNIEGNSRDFASATYGYGISVTPLQMCAVYCAIANGGRLMKPYIVDSIDTSNGVIVEQYSPTVVRQVISEKTSNVMRKVLAKVTEPEGTAKRAAIEGFSVGGKTGTADKYDPKLKRYDSSRSTASFAGIMPINDPKFVCLVVIDDPQTNEVKHGGGTMAAPVFARAAKRIAAHMNLTADPLVNKETIALSE